MDPHIDADTNSLVAEPLPLDKMGIGGSIALSKWKASETIGWGRAILLWYLIGGRPGPGPREGKYLHHRSQNGGRRRCRTGETNMPV